MNKYTVVYAHQLPLGMGVAAYHCSLEIAESAEEAAKHCERALGNYCLIITVMEGHQTPVLRGSRTICWDQEEAFVINEIPVPMYKPPHDLHPDIDNDDGG